MEELRVERCRRRAEFVRRGLRLPEGVADALRQGWRIYGYTFLNDPLPFSFELPPGLAWVAARVRWPSGAAPAASAIALPMPPPPLPAPCAGTVSVKPSRVIMVIR